MAVSELFYFDPPHFLKMYYFQLFENIKYLHPVLLCLPFFLISSLIYGLMYFITTLVLLVTFSLYLVI